MGEGDGVESGSQQDPIILQAGKKLEALGFEAGRAEILSAETLEQAKIILNRERHATSVPQLVMMTFPVVYAADAQTKANTQQVLLPIVKDWGVPVPLLTSM